MPTGSERFAFLGRGFAYIYGQIVLTRVMTLMNTNLVVSKLKKGKRHVATKASCTPPNQNFPGITEFFFFNFLLRISE